MLYTQNSHCRLTNFKIRLSEKPSDFCKNICKIINVYIINNGNKVTRQQGNKVTSLPV